MACVDAPSALTFLADSSLSALKCASICPAIVATAIKPPTTIPAGPGIIDIAEVIAPMAGKAAWAA